MALLAFVAVSAVGSGTASAASSDIEGIWSFGGGAVGIQGLENGTFQGTVVSPTTFATCEHPIGQVMWTDMRLRPDGSYWGFHQWYHGTNCEADPELGLTAWRVLTLGSGTHLLAVCFSKPGDSSQPKIAPSGFASGASYDCEESSPLAPLPGSQATAPIKFQALVGVPSSGACRRSLTLTLRNPKYDPLKEVLVRVNGKKVADVRGNKRLQRKIVLGGLPEGPYKVRIVAVTVLNQRFSRSRTYRGCTGKLKVPGPKAHSRR